MYPSIPNWLIHLTILQRALSLLREAITAPIAILALIFLLISFDKTTCCYFMWYYLILPYLILSRYVFPLHCFLHNIHKLQFCLKCPTQDCMLRFLVLSYFTSCNALYIDDSWTFILVRKLYKSCFSQIILTVFYSLKSCWNYHHMLPCCPTITLLNSTKTLLYMNIRHHSLLQTCWYMNYEHIDW